MAQIVQYQQQTEASSGKGVQYPNAQAPEGLGHSGLAMERGLDEAARGARALAFQMKEREEEEARAWSATALSQARLDWTQQMVDRQNSADPSATNFTPKVLGDFDEYAKKAVTNAPTESAKNYLGERLSALRTTLGDHALAFEAKARLDYRSDQFNTGIDNARKTMNTDPGQYKDALGEQLAIIDASAMPPIQKSALRQKAIDTVSQAAVWSQIRQSPSAFLDSIGFLSATDPVTGKTRKSAGDVNGITGNLAFDALPFDKRAQMFGQAIQLKAQLDSGAEHATAQKQKMLSDDAMKDIFAFHADKRLTRAAIEGRRPLLTHTEYGAALQLLKKEDAVGGPKTDPGTLRELLRIQGAGDYKAAEDFAFNASKRGLLSNEDLKGEIGRVRTWGRQEGPKSEYERSRDYIARSLDPGPMIPDPLGKSRFAEAVKEYDGWIATGKHTDEEVKKYGEEVVRRYKFVNLNDTMLALPMPRSGNIRRNPSDPAGVQKDIQAAALEADRRLSSKKMTLPEYELEMATLNRWRKAIVGAAPNGK